MTPHSNSTPGRAEEKTRGSQFSSDEASDSMSNPYWAASPIPVLFPHSFEEAASMRRYVAVALCGIVLTLAGVTSQARAGILPPGGSYGGRTYNQWQVFWWQTAFATPIVDGDHPLF